MAFGVSDKDGGLYAVRDEWGEVPLPPYIERPEGPTTSDRDRYQTVFAQAPGAVAAPIVIVVLNNAGGRIFEQLPIAAHPGVPLGLWTTPHAMRLRAAAELYGLRYVEISGPGQLGTTSPPQL